MLEHSREYTDGKFNYAVIPVKNVGNVVILENELSGKTLKKYFTEDDDSAIAIFESMIECQFNEGDDLLLKYKVSERLAGEYSNRVKVEVE
jgi:hypothetical protein